MKTVEMKCDTSAFDKAVGEFAELRSKVKENRLPLPQAMSDIQICFPDAVDLLCNFYCDNSQSGEINLHLQPSDFFTMRLGIIKSQIE